jgi:phosphoglycerol transferase MdoB-like AlkP superfamily enzyme
MKYLLILIRQLIYWLLLFALQRLIFLVYYNKNIRFEGISFWESLMSFYYAFKLDLATAAYILIFPFLLLVVQLFSRPSWLNRLNKLYTGLVTMAYLFISVGELGLYGEWNTKLSYKAMLYLRNPEEVMRSVSNADMVVYLLIIIVQLVVLQKIYNRYFYRAPQGCGSFAWIGGFIFVLPSAALIFIGIRGGVGEIPITISQAYYSRHNILNSAAVNPAYNLAFSTLDYYYVEEKSSFYFMPDERAREIVDDIHELEKDTTIKILDLEQPNIVIIFLESWSGDVVEALGGDPGITPGFNDLVERGYFFSEFYSSGNRSQQALASVFGGLPGLPITTLTDHPEKYDAVPSLIRILAREGYFTSFYFGGDLNYGNIRSYLVHNGFDRLVEQSDFEVSVPEGKLGLHDEVLFEKLNNHIGRQPRPFFTAALTLSSHSPYDYPGERPIDWIELENKYVNSVHYTDRQLAGFFAQVRQQPWYDSTLFIVLSDHSHMSYNNYQVNSFRYRRIPLLLLGGALKDSVVGLENDRLCSNMDLTSTLLKQLDLPDDDFYWSKNMLNPYAPRFAFFELNYGYGWKRPYGRIETNIWDRADFHNDVPDSLKDKTRAEGEAYIQVLLKEFLDY